MTEPEMNDKKATASRSPWMQMWEMFDRSERIGAIWVLVVAVLAAIASTVMVSSIMPFLTVLSNPEVIRTVPIYSWAYNYFGFESDYSFLLGLGIGAICVIAVAIALQLANVYVNARFSMGRIHSLSRRLMAAYLKQPYEHFLNRHSGDMNTRVLSEVQEVVIRFIQPTANLVTAALTILALVCFLVWVDPLITLGAFGMLGLVYAVTFWFTRMRTKVYGRIRQEVNSERFRIATEAFGGVKEIKLLGRESSYVDRFGAASRKMVGALVGIVLMSQTPYYVIQAIALGGIVFLCLVLIGPEGLATGNALTSLIPALGVFAFAGQRMMPELGKLYQAVSVIQSSSAAVDVVYSDMVAAKHLPDLPAALPGKMDLKQSLALEGISYRYPNSDTAGISNVSLSIKAGEKIGIVGGTGAGKTTLADLILGLLRPSDGEIVSDGIAIDDDKVRSWQQTVGYVPQDIFLTDSSIAANIALGVPENEIDMARAIDAAKAARIDDFVMKELPEGYDTFVGERGVRLSGGQKQRIGIARALYHDAELIVFDEATSALDNYTEAEVMAAIEGLPGDKTVLMIAHRLSTVKKCDRIVVMEQGRMVGCDTWQALLKGNASFQQIAKTAETA